MSDDAPELCPGLRRHWIPADGYELMRDLGYARIFRRTTREDLWLFPPKADGDDPRPEIWLIDKSVALDLVEQLQHWIDTGRIKGEPDEKALRKACDKKVDMGKP